MFLGPSFLKGLFMGMQVCFVSDCVGWPVFCCSKIGEEQSAEDAEDGPPELLVSQH